MRSIEFFENRIRDICPTLEIATTSVNRDGLLNDVVIVNNELVFRFAKRDYGFKDPQEEARVLRLVQRYVTLATPEPFYVNGDVLAYPLIPGRALRRDVLMRLPEADQQAIADQLAGFFRELHGIPSQEFSNQAIPNADALMSYEGWVEVYRRIREKVFPLMQKDNREWAIEHFESHLNDKDNFDYELKVVDTDVAPYHILFDAERRRINGIIDFGCAGLGDPALDCGVVINNYGESFLNRFNRVYRRAQSYLKRARFYAGAIELRWILNGIERNDPMWFAVHVGNAKDIGYNA